MFSRVCTIFLAVVCCHAAPAQNGIQFDKRADLPLLKLPYATYRAASHNPNGDIYTFKNIRFGAPPVGNLRWAKPAPPQQETEIQDGSYGPICKQAPFKGPQLSGPGASSPFGQAANQFLAGIPVPSLKAADEDCLFLDLHVPGKAIKNPSLKLPVISWFYGGAYIFGAKDQFGPALPLYDGVGVVQQSGGNVIFVSSNYRVGAFGFLAGTTMEQEGLPNAGLYDQRAVLQWIQDNIGLVGGDKTQVSAWGESAGAGSIQFHLTQFGGTQDPLFSKAVILSSAFQTLFDRKGQLEQTFQNFTTLAGCAGQGVACLRAASADALDQANVKLNEAGPMGTFAVGPAADGAFARQLPALEFASGNYWKGIQSVIISHVSDEADLFVPPGVVTDEQFNTLLNATLPAYAVPAGIVDAIDTRYPPVKSSGSNYTLEHDRLRGYIGESSFQCNARFLTDAYDGKNYNLQYSVTPGLHASDLPAVFYNLNLDLNVFGHDLPIPLVPGFGSFAQAYQSYLVSHARSGDPNKYKKTLNIPPAITWPKPGSSRADEITSVLNAFDLGFSVITDSITSEARCDFWRQAQAALTSAGGYAPPGSVVSSSLPGLDTRDDPSGNY